MDRIFDALGNLLALTGILILGAAGLTRLIGAYFLAGFDLRLWFLVGVGILVVAVLAKLQVLLLRQQR